MARILTTQTFLSRHVRAKDQILLVNPPVEETRYNWRRWNQPLDLLKIGSWLKAHIGCCVELFDFMQPDKKGKVAAKWLPRDRRYYSIKGDRYPMRHFGLPYQSLADRLVSMKTKRSEPTQVWVTSLCSYWYESVAEVCRLVRQTLPDVPIILLGQYARLMPKHASLACAADFVLSQPFELRSQQSAFDLYGKNQPPFWALQVEPEIAVKEIKSAVAQEIVDFTFFEEDICRDNGQPLIEIYEKTRDLHKRIRFHIICGLHPSRITPALARIFVDKEFVELHFEEDDSGATLDIDSYGRARAYLQEAGLEMPAKQTSGFVWLGRPGDQMEQLILRSFQVLDAFGGLILKPFSPTPGSEEHQTHAEYLDTVLHREWIPHFFPFSELNKISRQEYHDLYRMAAFLNERVHNKAFDFLNGTLGTRMLRKSLQREVWKLEPTPLRLVS